MKSGVFETVVPNGEPCVTGRAAVDDRTGQPFTSQTQAQNLQAH